MNVLSLTIVHANSYIYAFPLLLSQLKKRYGKDPLDVESLVPALPLPDTERAADCLSVITECFQAIAEALAEREAAEMAEKEKEKATKTSMFSFGSKHKADPGAGATTKHSADGAAVGASVGAGGIKKSDSAKSERKFIYSEESDDDDQDFRTPLTSSTKTPHPQIFSTSEYNFAVKNEQGRRENEKEGSGEGTEDDFESEDAMRLAEWDAHQDAAAGVSSRRSMESGRSVHLADDFKYW